MDFAWEGKGAGKIEWKQELASRLREASFLTRRQEMSLFDAYDPAPDAVLNPEDATRPIPGFPETVVITFQPSLMEAVAARPEAALLCRIPVFFQMPVYRLPAQGTGAGRLPDADGRGRCRRPCWRRSSPGAPGRSSSLAPAARCAGNFPTDT